MEPTTKMDEDLKISPPSSEEEEPQPFRYDYEIARYAPWNYLEDRSYKFAYTEWSEVGDVGRSFNGKKFTAGEYLYWERQYIDTMIEIIEKAGISSLIMKFYGGTYSWIINRLKEEPPLPCKNIRNLRRYLRSLKEGKRIRRDGFELVLALQLRTYIWCRLTSEDGSYAFESPGNFYMWFITSVPEPTLREIATRHNLFLNPRDKSSSQDLG